MQVEIGRCRERGQIDQAGRLDRVEHTQRFRRIGIVAKVDDIGPRVARARRPRHASQAMTGRCDTFAR